MIRLVIICICSKFIINIHLYMYIFLINFIKCLFILLYTRHDTKKKKKNHDWIQVLITMALTNNAKTCNWVPTKAH